MGNLTRRSWLRLAALITIVCAPIASAAWQLREDGRFGGPIARDAAAQYLAQRSPLVDRLLPQGEAGLRIVENLGGPSGLASMATGAIALDREVLNQPWRETVELHERAHLVEAFLPDEVSALMSRMAAPASSGIAADSPTQHFAEMAAEAWQLVSPPDGLCVDGTPVERLVSAEARVPGTAGFVLWYLRQPALANGDDVVALRALAATLAAPAEAEWTRLWTAIEARRQPDGYLRPWPAPTLLTMLDRQQQGLRASGHWLDYVTALAMEPSRWLVRLLHG